MHPQLAGMNGASYSPLQVVQSMAQVGVLKSAVNKILTQLRFYETIHVPKNIEWQKAMPNHMLNNPLQN